MNHRTTLISRRKQLANHIRLEEQSHFCQKLSAYLESNQFKDVAFYLAMPGEFDLQAAIKRHIENGGRAYVPILHPFSKGHLLFTLYQEDGLIINKYGIAEPKLDCRYVIAAANLDAVIMPLVGFDSAGHRIGMGGGYYDRTFSTLKEATKPVRIGAAFHCQQMDTISPEPWDIALHISPTHFLPPNREPSLS